MKNPKIQRTQDIPTHIKNSELVSQRRLQIIDAAVSLFIEKGFHKTTTREIARSAGISIGLLYEYVNSKEDVLHLVCEAIHGEVRQSVTKALRKTRGGRDAVREMIRQYFMVCHKMSDHILLIYQETRTLPPQWKKKVLENEVKITSIFVKALEKLATSGDLPSLDIESIELMAHNISVLGHMWTFRRWFLSRHYSIEDYIKLQTDFILGEYSGKFRKLF